MDLSVDDLTAYPIFPVEPYSLPKSKKVLVGVNLGDIKDVNELLLENRFLVYQIDSVGKNVLHRAVIKQDVKMVKMLIKHKPDIDACDYFGKTALTYAIKYENFEIAMLLLCARASPWGDKNLSYKKMESSLEVGQLVSKARKVKKILNFSFGFVWLFILIKGEMLCGKLLIKF